MGWASPYLLFWSGQAHQTSANCLRAIDLARRLQFQLRAQQQKDAVVESADDPVPEHLLEAAIGAAIVADAKGGVPVAVEVRRFELQRIHLGGQRTLHLAEQVPGGPKVAHRYCEVEWPQSGLAVAQMRQSARRAHLRRGCPRP